MPGFAPAKVYFDFFTLSPFYQACEMMTSKIRVAPVLTAVIGVLR
jgi:hypothetical protein